jgi:predicted PurR-regulated permease PerM
VLFIPIALLVGILSKEAYDLYQAARDAVLGEKIQSLLEGNIWIDKIRVFFSRFNIDISGEELKTMVTQMAKVVGLFLYEQARAIASNMFAFIINFILMLLVIFYLLIDGERLVGFIVELSPLPYDQNHELIRRFKEIAGAVLIGNGLSGLIQGVIGGAAFAFFNFNSPILWGVIIGILGFLPILGIGIVFIPTVVYLFLTSKIAAGISMMVFSVILSGCEYIFKPKIVGHRVKMHVILVFLSIIGGLKLFGMLGIIYGPLIVTGFLTLAEIYQTNYKELVESAENLTHPPEADF